MYLSAFHSILGSGQVYQECPFRGLTTSVFSSQGYRVVVVLAKVLSLNIAIQPNIGI